MCIVERKSLLWKNMDFVCRTSCIVEMLIPNVMSEQQSENTHKKKIYDEYNITIKVLESVQKYTEQAIDREPEHIQYQLSKQHE